MIPEFMGRLPIIVACDDLDVDMLTEILWKPKNALAKQYERLFEMDRLCGRRPRERGAHPFEDLVASARHRRRLHHSRKLSRATGLSVRPFVQPESGPGRRRIEPLRTNGACAIRPSRCARRRRRALAEAPRSRAHREPLGRQALVLDDLRAQVEQHVRDVDLHRADLVAGAAERRRVRQ